MFVMTKRRYNTFTTNELKHKTMTKEQALRIAANFYTHQEGEAPKGMMIKRMEPADGRITIWTDGYDEEIDEPFKYEIEIDPVGGGITMKKILREYRASDFLQTKKLSELKNGDLFRLEGDCVIYEFWRWSGFHGQQQFIFTRQGKTDTIYLTNRVVYPLGK